MNLNPHIDVRISKIKIYQELCHKIFSVLQRQMLDDMPSIIRTIKTKEGELSTLILDWNSLNQDERSSRLSGMRVEFNVHTRRGKDSSYICSSLDLFRVGGIEVVLQGLFLDRIIPIGEFLDLCHIALSSFEAALHGTDEHVLSIRIQSALTFALQIIGWSGKFIEQQLRAARALRDAE